MSSRSHASASLDAVLAQMLREQEKEIAALPDPTPEEVQEQAEFLRGWSRGKTITKLSQSNADRFYKCGKWMTKIDPKVVDALIKSRAAIGTSRSFSMLKEVAP